MREITFLKRNRERWEEYEQILENVREYDADTLAALFVELTDDLSYARTQFPKSKTTQYLNQMAGDVHRKMYRTERRSNPNLKKFCLQTLPLIIARRQREMLASLCVFVFAILIGTYSQAVDDSFIRLILGDRYVNMTMENIEKGDPLAVYKDSEQLGMSVGIGINNIRVAFIAYVTGLYPRPHTLEVLFTNGVMLGSFQHMFIQRGLGLEMFKTVYIHGALELSAIVIAGGAGLCFLSGFLFPGTYKRSRSFMVAARDGLAIMLGLVPVFVVAALLEGFVTRYTEMPLLLSFLIIGGSFAFIIWYFVVLPRQVAKRNQGAVLRELF